MKPGTLVALERVLEAAGWEEVGGRLIRESGQEGPVVGRTVWVARAPWWHERPAGLTEKRARQVVADALGCARMGARKRRYLQFLMEVAERERGGLSDNTGQNSAAESVPF